MTGAGRVQKSIRPPRLEPGARIGIVSPCYWMRDEPFRRAVGVFEELGYEVVPGASTRLREHRFAGTPEQRAADIMAMFEDPSIDAIVCARGGYGGNRVLPLLDYEAIARHPKIFVGYSDVTGYLTSIAQRAGLVTFHGPMLSTFGQRTEQYNLETFQRVLSGAGDLRIDAAPRWNRTNDAILVPGIAENGTRQMFLIRVLRHAEGDEPKP